MRQQQLRPGLKTYTDFSWTSWFFRIENEVLILYQQSPKTQVYLRLLIPHLKWYNSSTMNTEALQISGMLLGGIAVILSIIALFFSGKARAWHRHFRNEEQPENLEQIIETIAAKIKGLEQHQGEMQTQLAQQGSILATAIQHVGLIRFDSGADDGGNLSFSAAFLDAHQSGILITSLHGRQHNRVYTKAVRQGKSEQILSEEEKEAIIQAITNKFE